jgi:hypothetical protein
MEILIPAGNRFRIRPAARHEEITMTARRSINRTSIPLAAGAAAGILLIVSAAGAAERVVLGEYFTNLF